MADVKENDWNTSRDRARVCLDEIEAASTREEKEQLCFNMIQEQLCDDCGQYYPSVSPLDVVLTKAQWLMVNPCDGGMLCGNCIVKRASRLPGVIVVSLRIMFAEDYREPPVVKETS